MSKKRDRRKRATRYIHDQFGVTPSETFLDLNDKVQDLAKKYTPEAIKMSFEVFVFLVKMYENVRRGSSGPSDFFAGFEVLYNAGLGQLPPGSFLPVEEVIACGKLMRPDLVISKH